MCTAAWEFINRPGKVFVMLGLMRVTGDIPVQIALKELLGRLFFLSKSPSTHKICRHLQMTPHPNQTFGNIWIALNGAVSLRMGNDHRISQPLKLVNRPLVILDLQMTPHPNQTFGNIWIALNGAVSLRMGNDHRISQPLKLVNRPLVILEITLGCMRVKLEQKLTAAIETEIRRPFLNTEFNQLRVSNLKSHLEGKTISMSLKLIKCIPHGLVVEIRVPAVRRADDAGDSCGFCRLEPHLEGKTISMSLKLIKCIPHGLVVEIRVPAVRRADDAGDSCGFCRLEHLKAGIKVPSTIIDPGKNMAMNVSQR